MILKKILLLLAITMLAGCASGEKKANELLDTARFEEKQNNFDHATKLYEEILKNYPASQTAKEASTRLDVLKKRKP